MLEPSFLQVCRLCMTALLILLFYTPVWVFPGDSLFPLAVDDIMKSYCFLLRLHPFWMSHPIRGFPTSTHPHTCILPSGEIPQGSFFIHLSERKHLLLKNTPSTAYTSCFLPYIFKVSACSVGMQYQLHLCFNITCTYLMHMHMTKV